MTEEEPAAGKWECGTASGARAPRTRSLFIASLAQGIWKTLGLVLPPQVTSLQGRPAHGPQALTFCRSFFFCSPQPGSSCRRFRCRLRCRTSRCRCSGPGARLEYTNALPPLVPPPSGCPSRRREPNGAGAFPPAWRRIAQPEAQPTACSPLPTARSPPLMLSRACPPAAPGPLGVGLSTLLISRAPPRPTGCPMRDTPPQPTNPPTPRRASRNSNSPPPGLVPRAPSLPAQPIPCWDSLVSRDPHWPASRPPSVFPADTAPRRVVVSIVRLPGVARLALRAGRSARHRLQSPV